MSRKVIFIEGPLEKSTDQKKKSFSTSCSVVVYSQIVHEKKVDSFM